MLPLLLLAAAFLASIAAGLTVQHPGDIGSIDRAQEIRFILTTSVAALLYAAAILRYAARPAPRHALPVILGVGLAARLLVLPATPLNSTDAYRYVWDGRVQAAGINPYRYVPADPALMPLRDAPSHPGPDPAAIYPNVNRAEYAPTIYPPAAQAIFAATGLLRFGLVGMKAAMLGFDLLTAAAILLILRAAGRPATHVLVWAWNPLVIWEFANGGHIDSPAIAFTALAVLAAIHTRATWSGIAIGLAVATKLLPAAIFPALWRPLAHGASWRPLNRVPPRLARPARRRHHRPRGLRGLCRRRLARASASCRATRTRSSSPTAAAISCSASSPSPGPSRPSPARPTSPLACSSSLPPPSASCAAPLPADPAARAYVIGLGLAIITGTLLAVLSPHYPWYLTALVLPAALLFRRSRHPTALRWNLPPPGVCYGPRWRGPSSTWTSRCCTSNGQPWSTCRAFRCSGSTAGPGSDRSPRHEAPMPDTNVTETTALDPRRYFEQVSAGDRVAEHAPVCLYLEVTNRCNLLCETCPRTFEALEPPMDLSMDLFRKIVDQVPSVRDASCCTAWASPCW